MVNHGAGIVVRNIVVSIIIRIQVNGYLRQKTIIMPYVVEKKLVLKRKSIVLGVTRHIAVVVGKRRVALTVTLQERLDFVNDQVWILQYHRVVSTVLL